MSLLNRICALSLCLGVSLCVTMQAHAQGTPTPMSPSVSHCNVPDPAGNFLTPQLCIDFMFELAYECAGCCDDSFLYGCNHLNIQWYCDAHAACALRCAMQLDNWIGIPYGRCFDPINGGN